MRRILGLVLILALPVLLVADEHKGEEKKADSKPNTLTPQEVRDGWLMLFDGETTFGWKIDGEARVEKGVMIFGGKKPTRASVSTIFPRHGLDVKGTVTGKGFVGTNLFDEGLRLAHGDFNSYKSATDTMPHNAPLYFDIEADTELRIHKARLRPVNMQSLFNGKNLDGWRVFEGKGKKSNYNVTKEGWLNVKDGPGDLQTTKLFDDFVLQLECISNGDRLNSGIFFRCIPGQYQQGYEAQIHNGWTDTPKKSYTIDEYDPKTHKLLNKKKIQSKAMDYGTGAIYRRMPARFGVAKDREWFAMTVVAHERHIATWVNGIQVVDWTDNRPDNDNARNGYRAAAGAISIQGHDPTTDLSFRNIRIAELPRVKK
jgi:hypothetical protein